MNLVPHDQAHGGLVRVPAQEAETAPSGDAVDLVQLWATIRQHRRFVLAVASSVFLSVMAVTLASRMQFRSSGRLYLGELDGQAHATAAGADSFDLSQSSQGDVGSEVEIIRSRSLVTQAILAAGLTASIRRAGSQPPRYYEWLLARRDPELVDQGERELRAIQVSLAERFREEQTYRVRMLAAGEYELTGVAGAPVRGRLSTPLVTPDFSLTLVRGFERDPAPGAEYDLVLKPFEDVIERVLDVLDVNAPRAKAGAEPVKVVTLEFAETSPRLAADFLKELMLAYLKERQSWKTEDATAAEVFVTTQLQGMKDSLDQVQKKLADYRSNHRVVVLDNEARAMIEQIAKYEEQRVAARLEVAALADAKRLLKGDNPPLGAYLLGEADDTVLEGMASSLTEARRKLTDLESRFGDAAPELREQRVQVQSQLESVRNYVSSRLNRAQENLGALHGIIGQFEEKLRTVPGAELGLAQLSRESEVYSRTYSYLLERQQQAAITRASTLSKNRILDAPGVALRESSPRLVLRLASVLVGLMVGIGLIVLRSLFAGTFQSESDVRRSVGFTPVLATIPRGKGARAELDSGSSFDVPTGATDRRFLEAFRAFRTHLYQATAHQRGQGTVVLVTSPSPNDGKTTCVSWLAAVLAADGRDVLVVDADLRKGEWRVPEPSEQGLRAVLNGERDWCDVVRRVSLPLGGFTTLEAGGSVEPEVLSSDRMLHFLREARLSYDFVLIDSASFPLFSDALVMSLATDWVLSVIRLENTPRKLALEHVRRLSSSAPAHAVVINDAVPSSLPDSAYRAPRPPFFSRRRRARAWETL